MTVSTELSHEEYTGNGVTTDFDFRFRIFEAKHLVVSVADQDGTERILTNGTDYTLRGVGSYRGGKVILKMPLAAGWKIGIARDLPAVQETDLRNQGKFFAEVHEDAFDYLTMLIQKSLGYLSLCLRKPSFISDHYDAKGNKISNLGKPVKDGDAVDLGTMKEHIEAKDKRSLRVADKDIPALTNAANRANKLLSFDNNGNPVVIVPESGSAADVLAELGKYNGVSLVGGAVYRVDSVDVMRSSLGFSPRPGDVCITSGYYTKGDGGGAEYVYDESNSSADDGFITHKATSGGAWVLIDNRSRLPLQVAGVKADGVTDDRIQFLSAIKSGRKLSLSGVVVISGEAINLSEFTENQSLGVDIVGSGTESRIDFASGNGGFFATEFFRDMTLKNLSIDNAAKDKTSIGFMCPKGAEYISWENVTFRFWKIGFDVHAWNSALSGIDVRGCQYGGLFSGTSLTCTSGYAHSCDYGWLLGFRYDKDSDTISRSPQALSYSNFLSLAADNCGISYKAGMVQGVNLGSSGAEGYQGDCVVDLSDYPPRTFRASLTISQLDVYVENSSPDLLSIIKEPSFDYGVYGSVLIKDCRMYSDRNIPLFSRSGMGFGISNTGFSREITSSDTSGISMPDNIQVGNAFDGIDYSGVNVGKYAGLKKTRAIVSVSKASTTSRVIIRVHDSSINFGRGISAFGVVKFFPVNNQAANAGADCGSVQFSVASDYAGGMDSVNAQKSGKLDTVSVYKRVSGSVIELAFAINNTIDYIAEIDFWCNGKFNSGNRSYYIEK